MEIVKSETNFEIVQPLLCNLEIAQEPRYDKTYLVQEIVDISIHYCSNTACFLPHLYLGL